MKLKIQILGAAVISAVIIAVVIIIAASSNPSAEVRLLKPSEFEEIMKNENAFVINTHAPYMGEIEGTDLVIEDWENVASHASRLPQDREKPILVYCRSGRMSASAVQQLKELGYKKVYDLEGGMNAWMESGRKLVNKTDSIS
ncbi:rhodanese-like domain-containing protein [Candidatus Pacearchaeota archaeon]|nr:rhodanese-like domain-containing protein [Candidatus Pacearchaeota archaeon]